jgi:hypothetical protein
LTASSSGRRWLAVGQPGQGLAGDGSIDGVQAVQQRVAALAVQDAAQHRGQSRPVRLFRLLVQEGAQLGGSVLVAAARGTNKDDDRLPLRQVPGDVVVGRQVRGLAQDLDQGSLGSRPVRPQGSDHRP